MMANKIRGLVSKKKKRYQQDGYDLDMTYITDRIVAMGFPAESIEGVYRNNYKEVKRFYDSHHEGHYKVYNLCSERDYDPEKFHGRVVKYPFDDHNAPPFQLMEPFCEDVRKYLAEDPKNVVLIHCKAGKGRTGVMICCYLLHDKMWTETKDALEFYGKARTKNGKGVTIPSQIRYVHYYGRYVREKLQYRERPLRVKSVRLIGIPTFKDKACIPQIMIKQVHFVWPSQQAGIPKVIFKSGWYEGISKDQKEALLELHPATRVTGDVKMEFVHKTNLGGKDKMFHLWFNTFFVENNRLYLHKPEIDKAHKDKKHKTYPESFAVEILFESVEPVGKSISASSNPASPQRPPQPNSLLPNTHIASIASQPSAMNLQEMEWSDSDLTTDDDDDWEDWEGLPITDV